MPAHFNTPDFLNVSFECSSANVCYVIIISYLPGYPWLAANVYPFECTQISAVIWLFIHLLAPAKVKRLRLCVCLPLYALLLTEPLSVDEFM